MKMVEKYARSCSILPVVAAGLLLLSVGCREKHGSIPAGSFRVVVDDIVDEELVLVRRITITAPGRRGVSISEKGGVDQLWGDADRQTGLMTAQVVVVADLIKSQSASESILRWMVRMGSGGATVGGPGLRPAGSAGSLREILSFHLSSGIHPLSQDIKLGHVQGRELVLNVR
jgi:hypothetical protein